jgi:Flp pilus assembly pilin Flp
MKDLKSDESGQAIVEYILATFIAILVLVVISVGFRKSLIRFWEAVSKDITAACPGCPPDEAIKFR